MLNLKNAYIAEKLPLLDNLYGLASNIDQTMYVDDEDTASNIESSIIESEDEEDEINYDDLDVQHAEPLDRDLAEQSMFIAANKTINDTTNLNSSIEAWIQANIQIFILFYFYNFFER